MKYLFRALAFPFKLAHRAFVAILTAQVMAGDGGRKSRNAGLEK